MDDKKTIILTSIIAVLFMGLMVCLFLLKAVVPCGIVLGLFAATGAVAGTRALFAWIRGEKATLTPVVCKSDESEDKEITLEEIIGEVANEN